eukprot:6761946-Pyramimonas_sp.AAC.1
MCIRDRSQAAGLAAQGVEATGRALHGWPVEPRPQVHPLPPQRHALRAPPFPGPAEKAGATHCGPGNEDN